VDIVLAAAGEVIQSVDAGSQRAWTDFVWHARGTIALLRKNGKTFEKLGTHADPAGYLISRVAEHGRRRAAEMREVSQTLHEVHIDPLMSDATARLQDAVADSMLWRGVTYDAAAKFEWHSLTDILGTE
jgi:hypothetical protein